MSFTDVRDRIAKACARTGRSPNEVSLLAVSKLQMPERIQTLVRSGHRDFGENYVQELTAKMDLFKEDSLRWHLIGHLQTNKVKFVSGRCALIHSVDSLRLAKALSERAVAGGFQEKILFQVNLAGEDSKEGLAKEELRNLWAELTALPGVRIEGLMTMPPLQNEAEQNRVFFRELRELRDDLRKLTDSSAHPMTELSMGTSHDFEIAIEEGATWIRVGSLLFGERPKPD